MPSSTGQIRGVCESSCHLPGGFENGRPEWRGIQNTLRRLCTRCASICVPGLRPNDKARPQREKEDCNERAVACIAVVLACAVTAQDGGRLDGGRDGPAQINHGDRIINSTHSAIHNIDADDDSDTEAFIIAKDRFSDVGGTVLLCIEEDGAVGIGTAVPLFPLHVDGGTDISPSGGGYVVAGSIRGFNVAIDNNEIMARDNGGTSPLYLNHEGGDVIINGSGNGLVGIGTSSPLFKLHVYDDFEGGAFLATETVARGTAIQGRATGGLDSCGVDGYTASTASTAVGVIGRATAPAFALWSAGNFAASGTKQFRIDHPLDPANWWLNHYCTESPEPLNTYSGNVVLDDDGSARVYLPEWFEMINRDFRYQLTAIGGAAPNLHIASEIEGNSFSIAGGDSGMKISWRVEAVRSDRYVQTYGAPVEVEKPASARGTYLHPELYGYPQEWGHFYEPSD